MPHLKFVYRPFLSESSIGVGGDIVDEGGSLAHCGGCTSGHVGTLMERHDGVWLRRLDFLKAGRLVRAHCVNFPRTSC